MPPPSRPADGGGPVDPDEGRPEESWHEDINAAWHEAEDREFRAHQARFPWARTANPNTADGELQNLAAFSSGLSRLSGPRRRAAQVVVWLILLGFLGVILTGAVAIVRMLL